MQPVSLLVLDINMPIITGLELCAKVKELYIEKQVEINRVACLFKDRAGEIKLIRPLIIYSSSLDYTKMN